MNANLFLCTARTPFFLINSLGRTTTFSLRRQNLLLRRADLYRDASRTLDEESFSFPILLRAWIDTFGGFRNGWTALKTKLG